MASCSFNYHLSSYSSNQMTCSGCSRWIKNVIGVFVDEFLDCVADCLRDTFALGSGVAGLR